jgi:hypothetical protein
MVKLPRGPVVISSTSFCCAGVKLATASAGRRGDCNPVDRGRRAGDLGMVSPLISLFLADEIDEGGQADMRGSFRAARYRIRGYRVRQNRELAP